MIQTILNIKNIVIVFLVSSFLIFGAYKVGNHIGYNKGYEVRNELAINDTNKMKYDYSIKLQNEKDIKQGEINKIKDEFNTQMEDLQATTDGIIDSLNRDNKRLYIKIKRSNTDSDNGQCSTTGQSDETAELSEGSSKFLIGQSIKADQWVKSLQAIIIQLNEALNKKEK